MDVGIVQPLLIIILIVGSPLWITLIIVAFFKILGRGVNLIVDLFKNDDEED